MGMTGTLIRRGVFAFGLVMAVAVEATAQSSRLPALTVDDQLFADAWSDAARGFEGRLGNAAAGAERQRVFREILERFLADARFSTRRASPEYRYAIGMLVAELPDSSINPSTNSPLSNPVANQLVERSTFTQLLSLAGDFKSIVSADASAVSLNLNAVALVGGGKAGDRSAPYLYARREALRRLGGSVTFGAKIPEKAITGIKGLPASDQLFDAISWDVKLRVFGDRDPRASRWYPLLIGEMGDTTELLARILGLRVDPSQVGDLRQAATDVLGQRLTEAKERIASSLQVTVKGAGVHLTDVSGKNKYVIAALVDKGLGALNATFNVSYNVADLSEKDALGSALVNKDVQIAAGVSASVMKNAIVAGRAIEVTLSANGVLKVDADQATLNNKNTYNVNGTIDIPFQSKAKLPISVTWSNDPNNLTKQKYVTGRVGVSYDFGAVWDAVKALQ